MATLRAGEAVHILGSTPDGEWLRLAPPAQDRRYTEAFAARFYEDPHHKRRVEVFIELSARDGRGQGGLRSGAKAEPTGADGGKLSAVDRAQSLQKELMARRLQYQRLPADSPERASTLRSIEDIVAKLDVMGVSADEVLGKDDPVDLLLLFRSRSFSHRDFANPEAETCWLSCLFQTLWHSVVFHVAFDIYLGQSRCSPQEGEKILTALQRTWVQYAEAPAPRLVPVQDLVEAFGKGYGDMSEALASIQTEFSESPNPAVAAVAELMILVPLSTLGETWPTPAMAWKQVEEWKATSAPLIAVDLSLQAVTQANSRHLSRLWLPATCCRPGRQGSQESARGGAPSSDLGPAHRLVALVCYLWNFQHYVAFCRRHRTPSRCILFNDLPGLTLGAPSELEWEQVPEACHRYSLTPRLALYESLDAAEEVVRRRRQPATGGPAGAADGRRGCRSGTAQAPDATIAESATNGEPAVAAAAQRRLVAGPRQEVSCTHQ